MSTAEPNLQVIGRDPVPPALRRFIWDIQSMVELAESEREILLIGRDLMARLLATDDWLPTAFAVPHPAAGRQFQIFRDGLDRFAVVSTILSSGSVLTISQPSVWEIAGVLRGSVNRQQLGGSSTNGAPAGASGLLQARMVELRSSGRGEVVEYRNGPDDPTSVVIHVYGGDIGRISRRSGASGDMLDAQPFANAESAPPYDIFSIQSEIRD